MLGCTVRCRARERTSRTELPTMGGTHGTPHCLPRSALGVPWDKTSVATFYSTVGNTYCTSTGVEGCTHDTPSHTLGRGRTIVASTPCDSVLSTERRGLRPRCTKSTHGTPLPFRRPQWGVLTAYQKCPWFALGAPRVPQVLFRAHTLAPGSGFGAQRLASSWYAQGPPRAHTEVTMPQEHGVQGLVPGTPGVSPGLTLRSSLRSCRWCPRWPPLPLRRPRGPA